MTIILRLTGLSVKAGIEDIRTLFENLRIPAGGVYILGGSLQEAFVAFNTEKDAQLALRLTGSLLRGSPVSVYVSSMQEVEHKLELLLKARKKNSPSAKKPQPAMTQTSIKSPPQVGNVVHFSPSPASSVDPDSANGPHFNVQDVCSNTTSVQTSDAPQLDSNTAFLLGVCTVLQGLQSSQQPEIRNLLTRVDFQKTSPPIEPDLVGNPEQTVEASPGYVRLFGLPTTTTKDDICTFFKGLSVHEALVNVKLGINHGCLVKFASNRDECKALCFNQQFLGDVRVEVRGATERMWNSALQEIANAATGEVPQENHLNGSANHKEGAIFTQQLKRISTSNLPCHPSKVQKFDIDPRMEQVVVVKNLPNTMTKTEIKELFGCTNIPHKNVLHLLDKESNRTDRAFLIFQRAEDYDYALNLSGCHVGAAEIEVSPISKVEMREMISRYRVGSGKPFRTMSRNKLYGTGHSVAEVPRSMRLDSEAQTCLFVRNMPATVHKSQISNLFKKYKVTQENVTILHDVDGKSIGEAMVQFDSASHAQEAQKIHGKSFLGSNLILTLITTNQMEDILENHKATK